ncbi:2-keto-4-pentenoate hydratase [soil metagenome]|jgi:2-keto-4-pentenoate hydratase
MTAQLTLETAAARLRQATISRVPIVPLTQQFPELDIADAWQIQQLNLEQQLADGRGILGYKVGLTSLAMQEQMGVDEPDFGVLTDDMLVTDGVLDLDRYVQPRVEAEIALILGADLGRGATAADVRAATAFVQPSLEIIDSRIADWKLSLIDTVADNASSGAYVVGELVPFVDLDLLGVETVININGVEKARGFGSAALGDPAEAAAWLVNRLADFGLILRAGSVVMTGSLHASLPLQRGDEVIADFTSLGSTRLFVR